MVKGMSTKVSSDATIFIMLSNRTDDVGEGCRVRSAESRPEACYHIYFDCITLRQ